VDEYDRITLCHLFLKCYHHLHPMIEFVKCVNQTCDENSNLDIFQQNASTSEPSKELVTRELLFFRHDQVNPKDIKCFFPSALKTNWCKMYEN
jgi:hypothetical protein